VALDKKFEEKTPMTIEKMVPMITGDFDVEPVHIYSGTVSSTHWLWSC